jgi:hypothetical protein
VLQSPFVTGRNLDVNLITKRNSDENYLLLVASALFGNMALKMLSRHLIIYNGRN